MEKPIKAKDLAAILLKHPDADVVLQMDRGNETEPCIATPYDKATDKRGWMHHTWKGEDGEIKEEFTLNYYPW